MQVAYLSTPATLPGGPVDVAVATDWEATAALWDVEARRRVFRVEVLPHAALGAWQAERIAALLSLDLPVDFLAVGASVGDALRELRPDARVTVVAPPLPSVPREVTARAGDGPLRVFGEGPVTRAAEPVAASGSLGEADVALLLDPHLPVAGVLEALVRGVVPVVLPTAPAAELVAHLRSGVVAEPDDDIGTARWLDTLARDRGLLASLAEGARAVVADWPDAEAEERAALQAFLDTDPPPSDAWGGRVMADALAAVAVWRNEHYKLAGELKRLEQDEAVQAGLRARELWRHDPRLQPVKRVARPLLKRLR